MGHRATQRRPDSPTFVACVPTSLGVDRVCGHVFPDEILGVVDGQHRSSGWGFAAAIGNQIVVYGFVATHYPTEVRGTALGLTSGIGRRGLLTPRRACLRVAFGLSQVSPKRYVQ